MAKRIIGSTPKADGYRMPAEFEPQDGVWMLWPERNDNWRDGAKPAQKAFLDVATAILQFEPVTVWPSWPRPKRPSPPAKRSSKTLKSSSLRAKWILPQAATSWPTAKSSSTPLKTAARRSLPAASFCSASPLT